MNFKKTNICRQKISKMYKKVALICLFSFTAGLDSTPCQGMKTDMLLPKNESVNICINYSYVQFRALVAGKKQTDFLKISAFIQQPLSS